MTGPILHAATRLQSLGVAGSKRLEYATVPSEVGVSYLFRGLTLCLLGEAAGQAWKGIYTSMV